MAVDPILSDLLYVMQTGQELEVLNFYKSLPVTCKASVESITRDVVTLKVQPPGSVILIGQKETTLLSRGLPEAVRAAVAGFDLLTGSLRLRDFAFTGARFGKRMIARVQPNVPMAVEIHGEDQHVTGRLVDISLTGAGVLVREPALARGQLIQVTLPLPEKQVSLPGKVYNLSPAPRGFTRLSVGFSRGAPEIAVVMNYIKERRAEILAEIEQMYERAARDLQAGGPGRPE